MAVNIVLNGEGRSVLALNVLDLLEEIGVLNKRVAVELNREVISRDSYCETPLREGDQVEVVQFVAGG